MKEGTHDLELVVSGKVSLLAANRNEQAVAVILKRRSSLMLLPADAPGIELIDDAVTQKKAVDEIRVAVYYNAAFESAFVAVDRGQFATDLAFDVIVRAGNREWKTSPYKMDATISTFREWIPKFDRMIGMVDVVVRSDPGPARATVGMTRIWSGELLFKDVTVIEVKNWNSDVPLSPVRPLVVGK
jgi:hypothetical protein